MAPIVADALAVTGSAAGRGLGASALATSLAVHGAGIALLLLLVSAPSSPPQPLPIREIPIVILQGGEIDSAEQRAAPGDRAGGATGEPADAPAPVPAPMPAVPVEPPVREAVTASLEAEPPVPVEAAPAASTEAVAVSWMPAKPPRKAPKRPPAPAAVDLEATLAKPKPVASPQRPKPAATAQALKLAAAPKPLRALPVSLQPGGESAVGDGGQASGPTQARFSGQGLSNPAPRYPMTARRRGQEGRVLLRVLVTTEGLPGAVSLLRSSGHRLLDKAAMAAVEDWRFLPARLRGAAILSEIDVPIAFKLTD